MRRTACSEVSGSGSRSAFTSGSAAAKLERVGLREARADEHVLDQAAQPLVRERAVPNIALRVGSVKGIRSRPWTRATSSTRSISRVTSTARQVGTMTFQSSSTSNPSRSSAPRCSSGEISSPTTLVRPVGAERERPAARAARPSRRRGPPTARPSARGSARVASTAACSARCGSTPFSQRFEPSVRSACRSELRRMPTGSKLAASRRTFAVSSRTSVSSPPMIPAKAIAPSASAMTRSLRVELPRVPVEGGELLALARPAHHDLPPRERVEVEGMQRVAEREHDVVGHVDDVGDRPHARSGEARLQPRRRGRDGDVREEPADVARAALVVLDAHVDGVSAPDSLGIARRAAARALLEERRDLARDP